MLSTEEVLPILRSRARSLCRKFKDADLEEDELIGEAWKRNPCSLEDGKLASVAIGRDMLDYVRTKFRLSDKYHAFATPIRVVDPSTFYDKGYIDRRFDGVDFQDFLQVLFDRSNLRPLEKRVVIQVLLQGRTNREVAHRVGRSTGCVSNSLTRAKTRLREVCIDLGVQR
jgi:hypothetical protein